MALPSSDHKSDLLGTFAHHKVAANLLMLIMLLAGIFALSRLNIQFFPNATLDIITVRVVWTGASAEDVEVGITTPLEQRLKVIDNLNKLTSTSAQGVSSLTLEFEDNTDMVLALDQVRREVDGFRNLPQEAEKPVIVKASFYESIARIIITGPDNPEELRGLAHQFENELLARGIDKVDLSGLPEQEISIEIPSRTLNELQLSLDDVAAKVDGFSQDVPAGIIGDAVAARELRSLDQRRTESEFATLPLVSEENHLIRLGDVATIERKPQDGSVLVEYRGQPAINMTLQRAEQGNSLEAAQILDAWLNETRAKLPENIEVTLYDERWQLIKERIMLLVTNGGGGLILVILILYLFLTGRVAFWVAVGIPTSFMATLFILYMAGGSINMISLFALIMALGIIVDDAIVVGEDAVAHFQMGEEPLRASEGGARRMLAPVMASSLTTISAFLPLMMIGDFIGKLMFAIPLVIISVIIASVIESFLVLPGHLRHAFLHTSTEHGSKRTIRDRLDDGFEHFRDKVFRPFVTRAVRYRGVTIAIAIAVLISAFGLIAGGRMAFIFFPSPEGNIINANATFVAGTPRETVEAFLDHLNETLYATEKSFGDETLVKIAVTNIGEAGSQNNVRTGDQLGSIRVEMMPSDSRSVRNKAFVQAWKKRVSVPPGIENFALQEQRGGPPGGDVQIRLTGSTADSMKEAALELAESLNTIAGVISVTDDMPYGREQLIYRLTPVGESLGLTVSELGRQLRTAFDGRLVQIYQDGEDEVEVRVRLPEAERGQLATLQRLLIKTPGGEFVPLPSVARWESRRGFESLRHADSQLAVEVTAEVDKSTGNPNEINATLREEILPGLAEKYGINYSFEGRAAEQRDTAADMKAGAILGLTLMYLILAWVFSSYGWPLIVMLAIPFGLIGAVFGHYLMGINLTILSIFGIFGLSGIVVNDSIILVTFYRNLREQGMAINEALVEAACQRLRAVLLTSLTTIAGLTPLLFETSLQAQFLIPMATSIAFGLAFATLLILFVVPSMLSVYESAAVRLGPKIRALTGRPPLHTTAG
ncbi:MAG: efflux RND transporter permease subunit [Gammaproteobacteria bacterium]